ncbi:nickel-type superoxide dismutase maturation protease [Synechococcus sp. MIT S9504]|uniref:nickel-type superoxide dismutase maturation protease n=1 Tax=Synechococcus sp. MIT S9504 TaxID=1801628 RepID=UPI0007BB7434|nr:nickel-type superoxide dismutase maturation protease [Synechococcus sp. MIT S9504]KZR86630.1 Peptidase S24-like protein [Synechococcus sp. MIT S9504]
MNNPIPAAGLKDLLLFFLGRRRLFQVEGDSMLPALQPKQRLLVKSLAKPDQPPSPGTVVVCHHPSDFNLVITKRVWHSTETWLELRGDNQDESTDSRHFGPVPLDRVIGVVTAVIPSTSRKIDNR